MGEERGEDEEEGDREDGREEGEAKAEGDEGRMRHNDRTGELLRSWSVPNDVAGWRDSLRGP